MVLKAINHVVGHGQRRMLGMRLPLLMGDTAVNSLAGVKGHKGNCSHLNSGQKHCKCQIPIISFILFYSFIDFLAVCTLGSFGTLFFPRVKSENC